MILGAIIGDPTKQYDGNTTATLTSANFQLSGLVGTDNFTVTQTSGTYNSKDVATANTVTANLTAADFTAGAGTSANSYVLPTTASGSGHITKATPMVTVSFATSPITYDGDPHPASASVTGVGGADISSAMAITGAPVPAFNRPTRSKNRPSRAMAW